MDQRDGRLYPYLPEIGCALVLAALLAMCLLPYIIVDAMSTALAKLHLWPPIAALAVAGIFLGGLINVPVKYVQRDFDQYSQVSGWQNWIHQCPLTRRGIQETIIAVNIGGCVIPTLLAVYELIVILTAGGYAVGSAAIVTLANVLVCYYVARPVAGVGIAMPGFVSPAVTVSLSWLLLSSPEFHAIRAPIAFSAGVLGPLIGADLLHLRDITKISVGMLSIGGAGTFDGIVLSGMVATLLT